MEYEFSISNLFINDQTKRLNYASNNYNTNNLISWKERGDILTLIEFLTIYGDVLTGVCVCYSDDNSNVNFVAKLFPKLKFEVFGGKVNSRKNVNYISNCLENHYIEKYRKMQGVLLFMNLNNSKYWDLRKEELKKRGLTEESVNRENLNGAKYFLIKEALRKSTKRCEFQIEQDMIEQNKVLMAINPLHCMMRFRLPYNSNDKLYINYLKGIVYFPIWGKDIQRDTWLKPIKNEKGNYELGDWNAYDYETWIFNQNIVERQERNFINFFTEKVENIYSNELTNGFDSMAESLILVMFYEKTEENNYEKAIELSNKITKFLNKGKKNVITLAKLRFMRDSSLGYTSDLFA